LGDCFTAYRFHKKKGEVSSLIAFAKILRPMNRKAMVKMVLSFADGFHRVKKT
jgi:hypothetical protein